MLCNRHIRRHFFQMKVLYRAHRAAWGRYGRPLVLSPHTSRVRRVSKCLLGHVTMKDQLPVLFHRHHHRGYHSHKPPVLSYNDVSSSNPHVNCIPIPGSERRLASRGACHLPSTPEWLRAFGHRGFRPGSPCGESLAVAHELSPTAAHPRNALCRSGCPNGLSPGPEFRSVQALGSPSLVVVVGFI